MSQPEPLPLDEHCQAPEIVDTGSRPEDGEQDVDQDPGYEEVESDDGDEVSDPEVGEVA